ncbi:MAG TPA: outer membrane beta-barrel protein [Gemmatimonadales bacterium]|nr:outer membrane beta-barrel protein [Gemmatimonadales bacterium]
MNNSWWCLPVCICALGATPVAAQGARPQFGFGIGASIPTGAFRSDTTGEGFAGGWLFTGHVTLRAPLRLQRLRLRIDAGVARHDANDRLKADLTTAFGQPADEHMTLLGADANVVYPLARGSRFAPSLFGGIGVWHSSVSVRVGGASTNTSATKLGWQLGSEVTSGPIFLELRYVMIAAAKGYPRVSFFPVTLGARFGKRGTTP